jgi:hypothetical protein
MAILVKGLKAEAETPPPPPQSSLPNPKFISHVVKKKESPSHILTPPLSLCAKVTGDHIFFFVFALVARTHTKKDTTEMASESNRRSTQATRRASA